MKFTCMLTACLVSWFLSLNAFLFSFFYCGIRKRISILIGTQNGRISSSKNVIFLWKMFFLKLNFQDEDQLYANCLFHILSLYRKYFLFQFLIGSMHMHIHILTGLQTWRIISWKIVIFVENSLFWRLIDKLEMNCMWMSLSFFDNLWQYEQKFDFSVGNNLFGQLSDITDQQSCFYSSEVRLVWASWIQLTLLLSLSLRLFLFVIAIYLQKNFYTIPINPRWYPSYLVFISIL